MFAARRLALLAAIAVIAALLAVPGLAGAQTTTVPQLQPTITTPKTPTKTTPSTAAKGQLPNTGVDARLLAAVGIALLLCGIGLRMRSADEHF